MADPFNPVVPCVFCGASADVYRLQQTVAGEKRAVCRTCAETGGDWFRQDPRARASLQCLHLTALELEAALSRPSETLFGRELRARAGIRARFAASAFRAECGCATCNGREVVDTEAARIVAEVHAELVERDRQAPSLALLRTLSGSERVQGPDGQRLPVQDAVDVWRAHNRAVMARPEVGPDALSSRAAAAVANPVWHRPSAIAKRHAKSDAVSTRHWLMVRKYGPGLRDGDYWLSRDGGYLIPLDAADRAFPMTDADKRALAADRARAAAWREKDKPLPGVKLPTDDAEHLAGVAEYLLSRPAEEREAYLRLVVPERAERIRALLGASDE
jgi:hypothetical protein